MMKKIIYASVCLAAVFAAASCEKQVVETDLINQEQQMVPASLSAGFAQTRVSIDGVSPKWTSGDRIAVFTTDGTLCPAFSTEDSGSSAKFSGTKPDGSTLGFAVYPYSAAVRASSGNYTVTIPAEQDGTIGSAVMAASCSGSDRESIAFSNLACVIKLNVPASLGVRKVEIVSDSAVSGEFTVDGNLGITTPKTVAAGADRVSVSSGSALSGDIFISIIPSSERNLQVVLSDAAGKKALLSNRLRTSLLGGHIKNLGAVSEKLQFSEVALLGSSTSSQAVTAATQPAQPQVANGDFEQWTIDGINLPDNWNSFQTADGELASLGYSSRNRQVAQSTDKRPGSKGSKSCRIWTRNVLFGILAQGNLTTGRVFAGNMSAAGEGNYNYTDQDGSLVVNSKVNSKANPFHMDFTGRPDSLSVWIKFNQKGQDASHPYGKIEAILHDKVDYKSGYNASDCTGGSHHIGEASDKTISDTGGAWKRFVIPFKYDYASQPSFVLINIATNSYPGGGKENDEMFIDDIEMIYNQFNLRTGAAGWATLCLGYDALVPSGTTAYIVTGLSCGYASLEAIPAGYVIPKGTGVLVKGSANTTYAFNGSASDVSGKTRASVSGNLLKGVLTSTTRPSGTCRVLSAESTDALAAFGDFTGSTIAANTAYLTR